MYLAIDCSTSIIGLAILDSSCQIKDLVYIDLRKIDDFWEKANYTKEFLSSIQKKYTFEKIFIEKSFSKFAIGMSNADTLEKLTRYNGIVSYIVYEIFGQAPISINVNHARKACNIKIDRKDKSKTTKEKVFDWFDGSYNWKFNYKKTGKVKDEAFDMVDAFVICLAGIRSLAHTSS